MKNLICKCERCGQEEVNKVTGKTVKDPQGWIEIENNLLCEDCANDFRMIFNRFIRNEYGEANEDQN